MGPQSISVLPIDTRLPTIVPIFLYLSSLFVEFFGDFELILGSYPALFWVGESATSVYWTLAHGPLHKILNFILVGG